MFVELTELKITLYILYINFMSTVMTVMYLKKAPLHLITMKLIYKIYKVIFNSVSSTNIDFFFSFLKKMSSKFWAELSSDYEKLFETELGYDVIIYTGEEQNAKEIHAHSNILSIRSQYFRTAFSNEWAEKKDGKFIFRKPNISPQIFNVILR